MILFGDVNTSGTLGRLEVGTLGTQIPGS